MWHPDTRIQCAVAFVDAHTQSFSLAAPTSLSLLSFPLSLSPSLPPSLPLPLSLPPSPRLLQIRSVHFICAWPRRQRHARTHTEVVMLKNGSYRSVSLPPTDPAQSCAVTARVSGLKVWAAQTHMQRAESRLQHIIIIFIISITPIISSSSSSSEEPGLHTHSQLWSSIHIWRVVPS